MARPHIARLLKYSTLRSRPVFLLFDLSDGHGEGRFFSFGGVVRETAAISASAAPMRAFSTRPVGQTTWSVSDEATGYVMSRTGCNDVQEGK